MHSVATLFLFCYCKFIYSILESNLYIFNLFFRFYLLPDFQKLCTQKETKTRYGPMQRHKMESRRGKLQVRISRVKLSLGTPAKKSGNTSVSMGPVRNRTFAQKQYNQTKDEETRVILAPLEGEK